MRELTEKEKTVLKLLGKGLSRQEVADQLGLKLNTIRTYAANIFDKLDAKNLIQALEKYKKRH